MIPSKRQAGICPCCGRALETKRQVAHVEVPPYAVLADVCPVPAEILAMAEEIADGSDVIGVERSRLEWLLRVALYVDRMERAE